MLRGIYVCLEARYAGGDKLDVFVYVYVYACLFAGTHQSGVMQFGRSKDGGAHANVTKWPVAVWIAATRYMRDSVDRRSPAGVLFAGIGVNKWQSLLSV